MKNIGFFNSNNQYKLCDIPEHKEYGGTKEDLKVLKCSQCTNKKEKNGKSN